MVSARSSSGCGGGQIGRRGPSTGRGKSSNGRGGRREKTEVEKVSSDAASLRGSYRYLNHGMKPPPAFLWRESHCGMAALRASASASSSTSTSRAPQQRVQMELDDDAPVPGYAGDYVGDDELPTIMAALEATPSITRADFVAKPELPAMVGLLKATTRRQAEKEAEWRQIFAEQLYYDLDSDEE